MVPPTTVSGQAALRELTALSRELKYYADGFKATKKLKGTIQEIEQIKKGISTVTQRSKDLERQVKTSKKILDKTKEVADKAKKITDFLGKGLFKNINPKLGAVVSGFGQLAQAGFTAFLVIKQGEIQGYQLQTDDYNRSGIQDAFTRSINNGIQIKGLQKQIEATNKKLADSIDKTYAEAAGATKNATKAREMANEALYETRQGRRIIEGKIATADKKANDALYETRAGRQKIEAQISAIQTKVNQTLSSIGQGFQQQINTTITNIQRALATSQSQVAKNNAEIVSQNARINSIQSVNANLQTSNKLLEAKVNAIKQSPVQTIDVNAIITSAKQAAVSEASNLKGQINNLSAQLSSSQSIISVLTGAISSTATTVSQVDAKADAAMREAKNKGMPNLAPLQKQLDDRFNKFVEDNNKALQIRDLQQGNLSKEFDQKFKDFERQAGLSADQRFTEFQQQNQRDLQKIGSSVNQTKSDISQLEKQIKETDKMNQEGNKQLKEIGSKLDSIIPAIAGIPIVVGKAADNIIRNTPTIPDIEKAATTGVCRSTQAGGCMNKALNDQTSSINNNTSNTGNNILQALDTVGTGALVTGQQEILNRLGDQLPGGIGGKLERFSKWLHLDRALNLMIWATTIHNALMLSNDIGQTLLSAISNVLQLFGLKDSEGNAFDLGSIISSSIENVIKLIIGADNYTELKEAWQKANRIYQATINIFNQIQNLLSTVINALEITVGRIGKIGNALRTSGEVLENAYSWMNPQPKFNRITNSLEALQNGASTIQMVTQAPLDVINSVTELTNAGTEFTKALKEDDKPENKGIEDKEPDQLKAIQAASKLASAGQEMADLDLEPDED